MLEYLRIQRATPAELQQLQADPALATAPLNAGSEGEILRALLAALDGLLDGFTPRSTLEAALQTDPTYAPGTNKWAAAIVSLDEQSILAAAVAHMETMA